MRKKFFDITGVYVHKNGILTGVPLFLGMPVIFI